MARPERDPLFLRACRREPVERTPIWIMRQAGRYLPEYREVRSRYDFLTTCRTPELACELTLQPIRRLGVDAAILFSDILVPLPGMGIDVAFSPGPHIDKPVRSKAAAEAVRVADPHESVPYVMAAIRLIRAQLPAHVALIGFAGAPFTMATYLVEGGGSKSFAAMKGLLWNDPSAAHLLLEKCADTVAGYLVAQIEAGAQAVMLFDTWAGILSPRDYAVFAAGYARRVFGQVAAATAGQPDKAPRIYYAGDSAGSLEHCREIGADVIGLDWRIDLGSARRRLGPALAVQGNLDPTILLGPPPLIRDRTAAVLREAGTGGTTGHIFNLGHGILPETPPDHARALVEAVRELSSGGAA
ncbi:MAG: uroporphyrinogen decarboxylase [Acidobacteria bacterium]|nr:uroporphyrinogen decarboxylase [Acidobacteriota bacterium]